MKSIVLSIAALALTGCATPEQNILAGAAIGAYFGSEISRHQSYPQYHPHQRPHIHYPPPVHRPPPVYCYTDPYTDYRGWYRERIICR
jgi:hypothetical protein